MQAVPASIGALASIGVAAIVTAVATEAAIRYAQRRALIDHPGQRRSHAVPTPRGGGIAIVLAILGCGLFPLLPHAPVVTAAVMLALAAVAAVGWIDDHRPLGALPRLVVHGVASVVATAALVHAGILPSGALGLVVAFGVVVAMVWSINLHNFMDGINGLLAMQAAFVCAVIGWHAGEGGYIEVWLVGYVMAMSALAFLPFNAPNARVFMGDVGSGALGFMVAALATVAVARDAITATSVLVLVSAFVIDATLTLLSRMLRGRRWYSAHREHLYQWLVRSGRSHGAVTLGYLGWNLVVALPVVVAIELTRGASERQPLYAALAAVAVYGLGVAAWIAGKRRSPRNHRARRRSAARLDAASRTG